MELLRVLERNDMLRHLQVLRCMQRLSQQVQERYARAHERVGKQTHEAIDAAAAVRALALRLKFVADDHFVENVRSFFYAL